MSKRSEYVTKEEHEAAIQAIVDMMVLQQVQQTTQDIKIINRLNAIGQRIDELRAELEVKDLIFNQTTTNDDGGNDD